jgi:hypothetical protein
VQSISADNQSYPHQYDLFATDESVERRTLEFSSRERREFGFGLLRNNDEISAKNEDRAAVMIRAPKSWISLGSGSGSWIKKITSPQGSEP